MFQYILFGLKMHTAEKRILTEITENQSIPSDGVEEIYNLPLGELSPKFYMDSRIQTYCSNKEPLLGLRLALEEYLASERSQPYLDKIETRILQLPSNNSLNGHNEKFFNKAAGTYHNPLPTELLIRIYSQGDIPLSNLMQKYAQTPPARLFTDGVVPEFILQREDTALATIMSVGDKLKTVETGIIKIQRIQRMKRRFREEAHRITQQQASYQENGQETQTTAQELIRDANTPYKPKCDPKLADRIMKASRQVAAVSTARHITTKENIQSILDNSLYGKRTLEEHYLSANSVTSTSDDILNGDANVVCLGLQKITSQVDGEIVLEFDLDKLIKNKPSAFFKQFDFEYGRKEIREVKLGDEKIRFNHTLKPQTRWIPTSPKNSYLSIFTKTGREILHAAEALKATFISYNLDQMHEILTLNFFRFIDNLFSYDEQASQEYIVNFYQQLSVLTDEELVAFLTEIEEKMNDTAEFNFYGAHQIDFSTLINITNRHIGYTLNLSKFLDSLNQGNIEELRQARSKIPQIFQSYRFLDYLLQNVQNSNVRYYLDNLRKECQTPRWIKYTPLLAPEGVEINWEPQIENVADANRPIANPKSTEMGHDKTSLNTQPTRVHASGFDISTDPIVFSSSPALKEQDGINSVIIPDVLTMIGSENATTALDSDGVSDLEKQDNAASSFISEAIAIVEEDEEDAHSELEDPVSAENLPPLDSEFFSELKPKLSNHQQKYNDLIIKLHEFSSHCAASSDSSVNAYHPIAENLIQEFTIVGNTFFTDINTKGKENWQNSFQAFKSSCESLLQQAEQKFNHTSCWNQVKSIVMGFLGVVTAVAATLLTFGILTYYVVKDETLSNKYIDTFFKPKSDSLKEAEGKWKQSNVKQELLGDESANPKGLINEIEESINELHTCSQKPK